MAANSSKTKLTPIRVFVRIRPLNANDGPKAISDCTPKEVYIKGHTKGYSFDQIFDDKTSQVKIYKSVVGKMIEDLMKGYNCTVFAYGQTGTGKTYTILGDESIGNIDKAFSWKEENNAGIIVRAAAHLYEELEKLDPNIQRTVTVSFTEIYNEEIRDLLSDTDLVPLRLYEDKSKVVHIKNLREETVLNADHMISVLKKGCERRQVAATQMNNRSSRSHTVFTINVNTIQTVSVVGNVSNIICGKLNLIDLAGSENLAKSGSKDQRAREASSINQSLLTLGRVIKALVENSSHIPYRESKLTRILQDSLGGKTKTTIIATISPGRNNVDETVNTLDYAFNARHVTNCPTINLRTSATAAAVQEELMRLKRDLMATSNEQGIYMDKDNYEEMTKSLTLCKQDIDEKHQTIRSLTEQLEHLSVQREQWEKLRKSFEITRRAYDRCKLEIRDTKGKMKRDGLLLDYFESKSATLEEHADVMMQRESHFYKKLDNLYDISCKNQNVIQRLMGMVENAMVDISTKNNQLSRSSEEIISTILGFNSKICHMLVNVQERINDRSSKHLSLSANSGVDPQETVSSLRNTSEFTDKLELFAKRCEEEVAKKNSEIAKLQNNRRQFDTALEDLSNAISVKTVEVNKICDEKEAACSSILNQMQMFSEKKDNLTSMLESMAKLVKEMNFDRQVSEYVQKERAYSRRLADFSNVESNLGNTKEALRKLLTIESDQIPGGNQLFEEQKEELKNFFQNRLNAVCNVITDLLQNVANESNEVATVLKQITDILNVDGTVQVEQLKESISSQTEATTSYCSEVKDLTKQIVQTSMVPVGHVGDTPKKLDHPVQIRTRSSRNSLIRNLIGDNSLEDDCFEEEEEDDLERHGLPEDEFS